MTKIFPSDCLSLSAFLVLLLFKQCRLRRSIRHGRHHAVAGGLWSGLASRLQRVYAVPIAPRAVVVAPGPVVVGPGACGGRGGHRVCNGYRCWRVCNW